MPDSTKPLPEPMLIYRPYFPVLRCVWQGNMSADSFHTPMLLPELPIDEDTELKLPTSPTKKILPRIRMPAEIVHKLRGLSERQPPQIRPSIK